MKNILFLTQTPEWGAAARYRVYQYLDYLKNEGIQYDISPAVKKNFFCNYERNFDFFTRVIYYGSIIGNRFFDLVRPQDYDAVFLQRDIIVHLYPFLEKLIALRYKKIIFDFDDALFAYPTNKKTGFIFNSLWDKRKIERIIKLSRHVIVGNHFLKKYTQNFTKDVTVIPTSIDLSLYKTCRLTRRVSDGVIHIGWIGSQGTFSYLEILFPVFKELAKKYKIELDVIGAKGPLFSDLKIKYKDWSLDTEVEDINNFDIGVMPLIDDIWSRAKSATKLLQYMAAGIPAVASGVGANCEIIKDGTNGFLARSESDWIAKISYLIDNMADMDKIRLEARKTVEEFYSIQANAPKFSQVIREVLN